ncbi:MAG: transketolase family protein [Actinobacteria bacterium]|nr:transketolase family protein [Actinomycetota bacterium]
MNDKQINNNKTIIEYPKDIISSALVEIGSKNNNIVFISCDTSLGTGANEFKNRFPQRHIEFGIQEQNAISAAAGMALMGKIPYIGAHVPFITLKCVEQIRNDLCKTNLNVNIIGRDFGLQTPSLGPTHMIIEDIGVLRTLPNITIIAPSDGIEYRSAIMAASEIEGPVYIRVSRQPAKRINNINYEFKVGKGNLLVSGQDITLIATSTMVADTIDAAEILKLKGINAEVLNIHTIKPIDKSLILKSCTKTNIAVSIEEHSVINGLGCAVGEILIENKPMKLLRIGLKDDFVITGETYDQLKNYYGLTAKKIAEKVIHFINT